MEYQGKVNCPSMVFSLSNLETFITIDFNREYKIIKKNGDIGANVSVKRMPVAAAYCPFCGEKQGA